jgi:hypothetical protein
MNSRWFSPKISILEDFKRILCLVYFQYMSKSIMNACGYVGTDFYYILNTWVYRNLSTNQYSICVILNIVLYNLHCFSFKAIDLYSECLTQYRLVSSRASYSMISYLSRKSWNEIHQNYEKAITSRISTSICYMFRSSRNKIQNLAK